MPVCRISMDKLSEIFKSETDLLIHTGNINSWGELKLKRFNNSSEELIECLKLQLKLCQPEQHCGQGCLCLCVNPYTVEADTETERSDLKITLKVFMSSNEPEQVEECMQAVLSSLKADSVDRLILSLPDIDLEEVDDEHKEAEELLELVKPIWRKMEDIALKDEEDTELGVADLDVHHMQALHNWANVKPGINHYSIASCCTVPAELTKFARENDIQLLTHNDPKPFFSDEQLHQLCQDSLQLDGGSCNSWGVRWVGRYTVMIRSRSVITGKGYLVNLRKHQTSTAIHI